MYQTPGYIDEPAERLQDRAIEGAEFASALFKRKAKRLKKRREQKGVLGVDESIAAIVGNDTALAANSKIHQRELRKRIRRQLVEAKLYEAPK
jgi:hypothetical protein